MHGLKVCVRPLLVQRRAQLGSDLHSVQLKSIFMLSDFLLAKQCLGQGSWV